MGKQTAAKVKGTSKPGWYGDGGTLYLVVAPGGSKSWFQRLAIKGKVQGIGLGGYPAVSLAEAREKAFENRKVAREGGDPLEAKREAERQAKTPTFRQAAEQTRETLRPRWRGDRTAQIWDGVLVNHAYPLVGSKRVDTVTRTDVLDILGPLWAGKPAVARKLRQTLKATFRWCQSHGYIDSNPAGEGIDGALPGMPSVREHHRFLPYPEVKEALRLVDESGSGLAVKLCFRFLVLTAVRSGEAQGALWSEMDMEARTWTIGLERMKMATAHVVPLSVGALAVLEQARVLDDGSSGFVFPSPVKPGRPISDRVFRCLMEDVGLAERTTVHGMRSSFRTWASEMTQADYATMEMALAHAVGSAVERSYARSNLLDKRRRLMDSWASYLSATPAQVVRIA